MGKLNVTMLRYLSSEDFRVLTAVRFQEGSWNGCDNYVKAWSHYTSHYKIFVLYEQSCPEIHLLSYYYCPELVSA